ncbi:MAG: hypothetical protein FWE27_02445 [Defluviitaleaceae bacterium]|nr:hypothetical protein [Defluviitaleaceae bacterium]
MESKILLYDSNNVKIGETFIRRAKQLVKQQRAAWIDDSQNAVRFFQDVDDWETVAVMDEEKPPIDDSKDDAWLIALAERRIKERKWFILHSVLTIPVWLFLFFFFGFLTNRMEIPIFFTGVCLTAYLIHACYFFVTRQKYPSQSKKERRARALAAEVAFLKAELQR